METIVLYERINMKLKYLMVKNQVSPEISLLKFWKLLWANKSINFETVKFFSLEVKSVHTVII